MKKPYTILAIAIIIIIVLFIIFSPKSTPEQKIIQDCLDSGGSFNVATQSCTPFMPTSNSTAPNVNTSINKVNTSKPSGTTNTTTKVPVTTKPVVKTPPQALPLYYMSEASSSNMIRVANPPQNTVISSPVVVTGTARGSWFFEGSFPVILTDSSGRILAQGPAKAVSNWQTTDFVPFTLTLPFPRQITSTRGMLILKKDNPSGLPQNDAAVEMQVMFQ